MASYYDILGVPPDCSREAIRRAFRKKAKHLHPDVNSDETANRDFQLLNEAYQVLIHVRKRQLYDMRLRHNIPNQRVYYRPSATASYKPRRSGFQHSGGESEEPEGRAEKIFEMLLFISLILMGFYAIFYGLYRLFIRPHKDINPYTGLIFGCVFISFLIYVWVMIARHRRS